MCNSTLYNGYIQWYIASHLVWKHHKYLSNLEQTLIYLFFFNIYLLITKLSGRHFISLHSRASDLFRYVCLLLKCIVNSVPFLHQMSLFQLCKSNTYFDSQSCSSLMSVVQQLSHNIPQRHGQEWLTQNQSSLEGVFFLFLISKSQLGTAYFNLSYAIA